MGFNINKFASAISKRGVMPVNRFLVNIPTPAGLAASPIARDLQFFCQATSIPGIGIMTSQVRRQGIGNLEKFPYAPNIIDQNLTFYGDSDGKVWQFFERWMKLIQNHDASSGPSGKTGYGSPTGATPWEHAYKSEYAVDITIDVFDYYSKKKISVKLIDAFPVMLAPIQMAWENQNQVIKIPVEITFRDWYAVSTTTKPQVGGSSSGSPSTIGGGTGGG